MKPNKCFYYLQNDLKFSYETIYEIFWHTQSAIFVAAAAVANQVPLKKNLLCLNSMSFFETETSNWDTPQQINFDDLKSIIPVTSQNDFRSVNYT